MILKLILWGIVGYIVYTWFRDRMSLSEGDGKRTIHHHYHGEGKNKKKDKPDDEDYIDYEEL